MMKKVSQWMTLVVAAIAALGAAAKPLCVSGVYPHLAMVNDEDECGTGAVVPWAGSLWVITYGPHCPTGSSDKLYEIKSDLTRVVRPESVGGTPANRIIHRETGKLLIGQYVIDSAGAVTTVPISKMPGRLTGAARSVTDPARKVYVADMEEALYELDMTNPTNTFTHIRDGHNAGAFNAFFKKRNCTPPPGWNEAQESTLFGYHGKGTCSGFGKVFYANNGQHSQAAMRDPRTPSGCLAFWKPGMANWELIRTNQFTEVTTRDGIYGNEHPTENPIWALGWDHRSVILTTTTDGETWRDYRLPKGSHSYDGAHGWNTEWPRIREIGEGDDYLATMHGTFWRFPAGFGSGKAAGVRPRSTYLKVIGDFARWGDRVVFGCDDHAKSEFLNKRALKGARAKARRSESNLWFVEPSRLDELGPREGRGAVWSGDAVKRGEASDAFLFAGYDRKWLWLSVPAEVQVDERGDGNWKTWRELPCGGHDLADAPKGEWVRLIARDDSARAFAVFHYSSGRAAGAEAPFAQAAPSEAATIFANDASVPTGLIAEDAASLIYVDNGVRRRLPRRAAGSAATCGRICREVSTERDLLHAGEIFYELPADNAGGFKYVHPVAATARKFCDYDTWKGCLVLKELSGGTTNLVIGVADDLWRLGAPVGVGGPWKKTAVAANKPSDAYLMNGFDRKSLTLLADANAKITLEADVDGCGEWIAFETYRVEKGVERVIELPRAFSAYWVRVRSDVACTATAQFTYRSADMFAQADVKVDKNMPGGNIEFVRCDGSTVYLRNEMRDTKGPWFWWSFRVLGAAGRTLNFRFEKVCGSNENVSNRGACVSLDRGATWQYSEREPFTATGFTFTFPKDANEVWFSMCLPYGVREWEAFVARHAQDKALQVEKLCDSRHGRPVPFARVGRADARHRVFLSSRHHCLEATATYVLEGVLEGALASDEVGAWFRENVEIIAVPLMDFDGVVEGDQGKHRQPHDYNRDYTEFIWPETRAVRDLLTKSERQTEVFFDFHCPYYCDPRIHLMMLPPGPIADNQRTFARLVEKNAEGLIYHSKNDYPWGGVWNSDKLFAKGKTSTLWATKLPGMRLGGCYEIPYSDTRPGWKAPPGKAITADSCRAFGRSFARSLRQFLEKENAAN